MPSYHQEQEIYLQDPAPCFAVMAGLSKPISTHIGRHSFATMLLTSGIDLPVIQELMGHHDVKVTQIYAKVISRRKAEAIDALDRL